MNTRPFSSLINLSDPIGNRESSNASTAFGSISDALQAIGGVWQDIPSTSFKNNWKNYGGLILGTAACRITAFGLVSLRGTISTGTTTAATTMIVLPVNMRPLKELMLVVWNSGASARVDITVLGEIQIQSGGNDHLSLDGINYWAAGS